MLVELSDWMGEAQSVQYTFQLDGEESNYTLYLPESSCDRLESGLTTGPSGLSFSTIDRDNDLNTDVNCAKQLSGILVFLEHFTLKMSYFFLPH